MKKLILTSIIAILPIMANAGVIKSDSNSVGAASPDQIDSISVKSDGASTTAGSSAHEMPTRFYISIKGGSNSMSGTIDDGSQNSDSGIDFTVPSTGVFSGAFGLDFNDPSLRLEFEVSSISSAKIKFPEQYSNNMHAATGYTGYAINLVPYARLSKYVSLPITVGIGGASLSFEDTDESDTVHLKASSGLLLNLGLGLDIKVSDNFSITPEFRYSGIFGSMDYSTYYVRGTDNLTISNIQALIGLKITF